MEHLMDIISSLQNPNIEIGKWFHMIILIPMPMQATMPSSFKHLVYAPMWIGAMVAYILISLFFSPMFFPPIIGGYMAYGNFMSVPFPIGK